MTEHFENISEDGQSGTLPRFLASFHTNRFAYQTTGCSRSSSTLKNGISWWMILVYPLAQ